MHEPDKHIVGQGKAKRAVAIALRNRRRRQQVAEPLRQEITPKNILMIGPTGVGKTEIARRLARLAEAPFIKVEATKFTEVGYVGRDVDTIVRDLVEISVKQTREQAVKRVRARAQDAAEDRILDVLVGFKGEEEESTTRQKFRKRLREGELDDKEIDIEVSAAQAQMEILAPPGMEELTSQIQGCSRIRQRAQEAAPHEDPRGDAAHRRGRSAPGERRRAQDAPWPTPSRTASCSSTRSTRSPAAPRCRARTCRARACSATCCRWWKAPPYRRATAW